jgi:hypothetical protein
VKGKQPPSLRKQEDLIWPHEELRGPVIVSVLDGGNLQASEFVPFIRCGLGLQDLLCCCFKYLFRIQTCVTENSLRYKRKPFYIMGVFHGPTTLVGQNLLIIKASLSHHTGQDCSERRIGSAQRSLTTHNTS